MRAIWSGSLTFGLVNIPVKLLGATEDIGPDFVFLHKVDFSGIRFAKMCKLEGKEVRFEEVIRGFEYKKGEYVELTRDDFAAADMRKTNAIEVVEFIREKEIASIYFRKPYFLEPDKGSDKAYGLFLEALRRAEKTGVVRYVLKNREHLGIVIPNGHILMLVQLRYHEELRDASEIKYKEHAYSEDEIELALTLIDKLSTSFKPEKYVDLYRKEILRIVEEKAGGRRPTPKGDAPIPTQVPDLIAMLKKSIERQEKRV